MDAEPQGAARGRSGSRLQRVVGQERREVCPHSDRADARSATTVRDTEGLVQIQVADVRTELARTSQPDHRVEVCPVHVDLTACGVNQFAHLADVILEHPVGGWVGDHDRGEVLGVLADLGPEIVEVYLALVPAGRNHDDLHACQYR